MPGAPLRAAPKALRLSHTAVGGVRNLRLMPILARHWLAANTDRLLSFGGARRSNAPASPISVRNVGLRGRKTTYSSMREAAARNAEMRSQREKRISGEVHQ